MREILFRGKTFDGEWLYGDLWNGIDKYINSHVCIMLVDPDTVSEFTGLRDKNGKGIFEGHIVLAKVGLHTYIGIVKYDEKCAMFVVEAFGRYKNKTEHTDKFCFSCEYITEVIGNKWDNPELLEGGEE